MAKPTDLRENESHRKLQRRAKRRDFVPVEPGWRPQTRADCASVPRPCPYVGCRYNTTLDITASGGIRWRQKDNWEESFDGRDNCALDVAARGPQNLQEIANITGVCRERVRQELDVAIEKIKPALESSELTAEHNDITEYIGAPEDDAIRKLGLRPDVITIKKSYRRALFDLDE